MTGRKFTAATTEVSLSFLLFGGGLIGTRKGKPSFFGPYFNANIQFKARTLQGYIAQIALLRQARVPKTPHITPNIRGFALTPKSWLSTSESDSNAIEKTWASVS